MNLSCWRVYSPSITFILPSTWKDIGLFVSITHPSVIQEGSIVIRKQHSRALNNTQPSDKSPRRNGMILRQIMPMDSPFLFPSILSQFSWTEPRSRSDNLYLQSFPFSPYYDFLSWTELEDIDLPIYIRYFPFWRTIPFPIPLLMVWLYSDTSTLSSQGTFLVCLPIVLSLRKAPIGLVYKPTYVSLCPLASSTHQLPSNLVSSLELSLVSVPVLWWLWDWPSRELQPFLDNCSTRVSVETRHTRSRLSEKQSALDQQLELGTCRPWLTVVPSRRP